jgi:hypothetical protein
MLQTMSAAKVKCPLTGSEWILPLAVSNFPKSIQVRCAICDRIHTWEPACHDFVGETRAYPSQRDLFADELQIKVSVAS